MCQHSIFVSPPVLRPTVASAAPSSHYTHTHTHARWAHTSCPYQNTYWAPHQCAASPAPAGRFALCFRGGIALRVAALLLPLPAAVSVPFDSSWPRLPRPPRPAPAPAPAPAPDRWRSACGFLNIRTSDCALSPSPFSAAMHHGTPSQNRRTSRHSQTQTQAQDTDTDTDTDSRTHSNVPSPSSMIHADAGMRSVVFHTHTAVTIDSSHRMMTKPNPNPYRSDVMFVSGSSSLMTPA